MRIFDVIKKQFNDNEKILFPYASKSLNAIRKNSLNKDIRGEFQRDIDRIIHTNSYTRYLDKTQVYSNILNDNISKRMTHVQFVSRAARTIARGLGLNEDLCEAISLGHDVGHPPFGHTGESILNEISKEKIGKIFAHNLNSVRIFTILENNGCGCNLTLQVLDGIMCHNGEALQKKYTTKKKDFEKFEEEYIMCLKDEEYIKRICPMTLEGCVVKISDIIGYIGKDIEDAKRIGVIEECNIPSSIKEVLGTTNAEIMNSLILDVIYSSFKKDYITMSSNVYEALAKLKEFNMKNIYLKVNNKKMIDGYKDIFTKLFDVYIKALDNNDTENNINKIYLKNMSKDYILNNKKEQIVIDYLAGMTDRFINSEYKKYIN